MVGTQHLSSNGVARAGGSTLSVALVESWPLHPRAVDHVRHWVSGALLASAPHEEGELERAALSSLNVAASCGMLGEAGTTGWLRTALEMPTVRGRCDALLIPWRAAGLILLPRAVRSADRLIASRVDALCADPEFCEALPEDAALRAAVQRLQALLNGDPLVAAYAAWRNVAAWELAARLPSPPRVLPSPGRREAQLVATACRKIAR